ncbi:M23 family metallopeptidase [Pseudoclostridium thermosuccinogenes]|uniref:M23 family metallopeptidase n=1 Tax=Clostridium thermosuccinogenes TaxID=84032 RepID=UPI002FD98BD8
MIFIISKKSLIYAGIGIILCAVLVFGTWMLVSNQIVQNAFLSDGEDALEAEPGIGTTSGSGTVSGSGSESESQKSQKSYIKWVDFNVPYEAMYKAMKLDINSQDKPVKLNWIEMLAYLAAKNGGNFKGYKDKQLDDLAEILSSGKTMEELTQNLKYYPYYLEAYSAVLSGFVGEYEIEVPDKNAEGGKRWERRYGLKAFSPIAKNFPYSHYDDFGNSRTYGFKRVHLGNDLMGQVGTPIIAVEGGVVEAMGWNQYGGWRIGIRSHDSKRYYYYAHLRKNFPYRKDLKVGSVVKAGDVIGYMGRSGYSREENVNNIRQPHLHFGMQLIFDESQKEGKNEIWIDVYQIVRLLNRNRSEVVKNPETKDYYRVYDFRDSSELSKPSTPLDDALIDEDIFDDIFDTGVIDEGVPEDCPADGI